MSFHPPYAGAVVDCLVPTVLTPPQIDQLMDILYDGVKDRSDPKLLVACGFSLSLMRDDFRDRIMDALRRGALVAAKRVSGGEDSAGQTSAQKPGEAGGGGATNGGAPAPEADGEQLVGVMVLELPGAPTGGFSLVSAAETSAPTEVITPEIKRWLEEKFYPWSNAFEQPAAFGPDRTRNTLYVSLIAVVQASRSQGIGSRLLDVAFERARAEGEQTTLFSNEEELVSARPNAAGGFDEDVEETP